MAAGAMKIANRILGLALLIAASVVFAQSGGQSQPNQVAIGENTRLNAGALFTFGYTGDYGDAIPSDHGLTVGMNGTLNGYYYNPNFLSFSAQPYFNQSRADSDFQSLTNASGINTTANFFSGSHFPGSVSYHYDHNSSGTFGLQGQPNFTTIGNDQGFGINWSALLPNLPTLSVGYSQGGGTGTVYGTNELTSSNTKLLNIRSGYDVAGFRLNGFFDRNSIDSKFPQFLAGEGTSIENSTGHDFGAGAQHSLPWHGEFFGNYDRVTASSDYFYTTGLSSNTTSYTDDIENAGATFHPTQKLTLDLNENYTSNLSGYLSQSLSSSGAPLLGLNLGSGSHSETFGGGATYQITNYLAASSQATYYDQQYFGKDYTGTYVTATVSYGKRLLNTFTFSGSVVDSDNGQGTNALGFIGNVNAFRRFGGWTTSGSFSYAQNVQSVLITYTTSYYNYNANVHRRLPGGWQWTAAFNGTHSGLTHDANTSSHSEGYSTTFGSRKFTLTGNYTNSSGISLLGATGLVPVSGTPGVLNFINFSGDSYGGGLALTPMRRLVVSASYNRAISDTLGGTFSHNSTDIYNAQLQYHLRKIGLQAGYTRFGQGITATGLPANTTSYFVGVTRWFDFF
jgi:hypothetical protein